MPKKVNGTQRTNSALKKAANDKIEYLFIANHEVVKNLSPTSKARVMKLLSDYQKDMKDNVAEEKKYLEAKIREFAVSEKDPMKAMERAQLYVLMNPLSPIGPKFYVTEHYFSAIKAELYLRFSR